VKREREREREEEEEEEFQSCWDYLSNLDISKL
jgi:hypothetical protein